MKASAFSFERFSFSDIEAIAYFHFDITFQLSSGGCRPPIFLMPPHISMPSPSLAPRAFLLHSFSSLSS